jgi:uncharacterized sulfatase
VLLAISDDQSWPHASSYGADGLDTPAFDRVAREGVLFENVFVDAPVCSPSRAALLTGRHIWQTGQAGSHWSSFPQAYIAFPSLLAEAGYHTGHTGKGWGPGSWKISGREHNPAGPAYDDSTARVATGLSSTDYAANFAGFLEQRAEGTNGDAPFYFWYGAYEPHRPYGSEIWREMGVDPSAVDVPGFLPDVGPVRRDIASYAAEIEHFDEHLARMLAMLEERGELENTIVIVTSDNGMPFPDAKSTLYGYGTHVPLAIRWGKEVAGGRRASGPINLIDLAPTILEAAGVEGPTERPMTGESLLPMLTEDEALNGEAVVTARERRGHILWRNLSYPQRAVRTPRWLHIRNFKTERWPVGAPSIYGSGAPPTTAYLLAHRDSAGVERFFEHAYARRPSEQLFNIRKDPACLNNLAGSPSNSSSLAVNRERWACPWAARTSLGSTFSLSQNRYVPFTDPQSLQAFGIDSEGASPRARPICWSRSVSRLSPKSAVRNSAFIDPGVPNRGGLLYSSFLLARVLIEAFSLRDTTLWAGRANTCG